ncbi:putative ATP-dependent RNA helicase TDRD12 isoform X1 [Vespa velutina]|uniref:putative ATP-dependent RNA helicase TDRD12 isoform X1 n=1 Tax=Vespa velutina TaxID=202808 RepID=UPI001FB4B0C8|nr:putative ATP-dependent RNA helicase TDRD12 isoform X1 [Vespa velutina]
MDCPALINIFHTPKIIWYQTDNTIGIRVMLQDVKDYFLRVEIDHLFFSTILNDKEYYLSLYLFGSVIPEETTHLNLEREIKINLIKAFKWLPWLRLLNNKEKFPYVVHDLERLYEPSWRKDEKKRIVLDDEHKIAEYLRTQNILPDDEYTNDEDSDEWLDNEMLDDLLF